MRSGSFWAGLTSAIILAIPILAGAGLLAFDAVYKSGNYVALMGYGLLALGSLLGYRAIKAKAGPAGMEVEAGTTHRSWESIKEARKEKVDAD